MSETIAAGMIVGVLRIVAFAIAGLLAYFGYRLFFAVPHKSESGGKIETPGLTITLTRIAPGTFFAICGAGIVIASFIYPMEIEGLDGGKAIGSVGSLTKKPEQETGAADKQQAAPLNPSAREAQSAHLRSAVYQMNCIRAKYPFEGLELNAVDQARVALVARLWIKDWGEFQAFETWALEGRGNPPVTYIQNLFTQEDPRCKQ